MASFKEQKMRQLAFRRALVLHKERSRDEQEKAAGSYQLVDALTKAVVFGDPRARGFGKTLEEIETYLQQQI